MKIKRAIQEWLKENEISFKKLKKDFYESGYRDSYLAQLLSNMDGTATAFYLNECSEDGEYWIEGKITIEKEKQYFPVIFESEVYFNFECLDDLVEELSDLNKKALKTHKLFK